MNYTTADSKKISQGEQHSLPPRSNNKKIFLKVNDHNGSLMNK